MKSRKDSRKSYLKVLSCLFMAVMMMCVTGCDFINKMFSNEKEITIPEKEEEKEKEGEKENEKPQNPEIKAAKADSFFWGTWVRMDSGKEYEVLETSVVQGGSSNIITASDNSTLTVNTLGKFTKESDSVIVCDNIPYFRKGGANLEYSLKFVGFTSNGRAAGIAMSGIKGKGKSEKYKGFESNGESNADGEIKLKAPTANDVQTVEIRNGDELIVIPGLQINNSGDYMGTVALVGKKDYNLKITGTISDDQKVNDYLFGNNAKTYKMIVTITNISENKCSTSACSISSEDQRLVLDSETNLKGFTISTIAGGATKTIELSLSYGSMTEPYVDTGITVAIQNPFTGQEWKDYIPLRFFKGTIPITIAAKNPENNSNAALNGFVIYPDGNNQFFAIPNNTSSAVFVPTFGSDKKYMLVFSGATVTSQLGDSTEMYYTVEPASLKPSTVIVSGEMSEIVKYITFGGDNHSENTAYSVTKGFEAYLREGEIDYYKITADSENYYEPGINNLYSVSYVNEKGEVPDIFLAPKGTVLSSKDLPDMKCEGYRFLGWYSGAEKIVAGGFAVKENIVLTAKWLKEYTVKYVTEYGTTPDSIIVGEGEKLTAAQLPELTSSDYYFGGWYAGDTRIADGRYTVKSDVTLTARWSGNCIISYVTDHGTAPKTVEVESGATLTATNLPELSVQDWYFKGWYTDDSYEENKKASEGQVITACLTLYAKWIKFTTKVIILPALTDGTAGTSAKYVLFGDWPQTIKTDDVSVDESISEVHGAYTYYLGSDDFWYVKCAGKPYESDYKYSNGSPVAQVNENSTKYFKVEPIKWRVLTEDYNGTGKALLLAENILIANVPYYLGERDGTINSNDYPNNYTYSTIRAYLNGNYYDKQIETYKNKGFLQTAFTAEAQNLIAATSVNNTREKIFLLSKEESTTPAYGFATSTTSGTGNARIRFTTDFAKANYAEQSSTSGYGGWWWLRSSYSTYYDHRYRVCIITVAGSASDYRGTSSTVGGIVPALTISLQ